MSARRQVFVIATVIVSGSLFWAAMSNAVYEATSPQWLSWHVVLRKFYSIVAFSLVAALLGESLPRTRNTGRLVVLALAAYSALIEIGQYATGAREGWSMNVLDVVCGAVGGLAGSTLSWALGRMALPGKADATSPQGPNSLAEQRQEP